MLFDEEFIQKSRRRPIASDVADQFESTSSRSTVPRRCSQTATLQHSAAQAMPAVQPASTSVGQCTPK